MGSDMASLADGSTDFLTSPPCPPRSGICPSTCTTPGPTAHPLTPAGRGLLQLQ